MTPQAPLARAAESAGFEEGALAGVYTIQHGRLVLASPGMAKIFGYEPGELAGRPVMDLVAADSRELVERQLARRLSGEQEAVHYAFYGIRKDGERIEVEVFGWRIEQDGAPAVRGILLDVSERARSARALRRSEERFRSLIENSLDIIAILDPDGTILYASPSGEGIVGYQPDDVIGKNAFLYVHPEDAPGLKARLGEVLTDGARGSPISFRFRHRDGTWRFFEAVGGNRVADPVGGIVLNLRDVTRRKQAEEALIDSEARYRRIVETAREGVWILDADAKTSFVNPQMAEMLGYGPEEILGRPLLDFMDERSRGEAETHFQRRRQLVGEQYDLRLRRKDGSEFWAMIATNPIEGPRGEFLGALQMVSDITDRKRGEEAHAQLAALVEFSDDAITGIALDGVVTSWNLGAKKLYGYSAEEVVGRSIDLILPADRAGEIAKILGRIRHSESVDHYETIRIGKDERRIDVSLTVSPIRNTAGEITGASSIARDITERKRSEESIRKLLRAVEQTENAIFMTDPDGRITYVNPAFEKIYGFPGEEALGKTPRILKSGQYDHAFYEKFWQRLLAGESVREEFVNKRRDGRPVTVEGSVTPVLDAQGKRLGFIAVQDDISGRKLLEDQLRQAQKMEAVGRLAGGVAHDFNNLLTAILGYSGLLLAQDGISEPVREAVTEIHKAGDRASSLTRQLLAFSRKQMLVPEVLDLNTIVRDLEKMLRRLIGEDVVLVTALDPGLGCVLADPGQVEQVILNLAVNSRDAMPGGGTLTITTRAVTLDEAFVRGHDGSHPGRQAMLSIHDTGAGMDAITRSHIFEPFFTTKERGKGTGLGLATVYGIVKQSGGYIAVQSKPGQGAEFSIFLPIVERVRRTPPAGTAKPPPGRGHETLLLVEDDDLVRGLARKVLKDGGYDVIEASNAREALEKVEAHAGHVDLILTDIVMPGINGRELVQRLLASGRKLRVLYMSGYTDNAIPPEDAIESRDQFLQKPFTPDVLLRRVREALDRPAPEPTGLPG